jgi:RecB family exonuclease
LIETVEAPEYFSPSQIAFGDECLLRVVLGSSWDVPRLSSHPSAELGKLLHRLLERAVRGEIERRGELNDDLHRTLSEMLQEARDRLEADVETAAYADLSSRFPPLIWRKKMRTAIDVAAEFYRLRSNHSGVVSRGSAHPLDFSRLPSEGEWAEVGIASPSMRVSGRIDIVEKSEGTTTIRDLKSGRVQDRDGQIYPHIERQLLIYGILAQEAASTTQVRLVVNDGEEHPIAFDSATAAEMKAWVRTVTERLPAGPVGEPRPLATVGDWCARCSSRHVCPTYRETAPQLWSTETSFRLPLDIWGTVSDRIDRGPVVDIVLHDAAARRVKLFGVRSGLVEGLGVGDEMWCFGLRAKLRVGVRDTWRHPLNFYEIPDGDGHDRAWALEIFRSDGNAAALGAEN